NGRSWQTARYEPVFTPGEPSVPPPAARRRPPDDARGVDHERHLAHAGRRRVPRAPVLHDLATVPEGDPSLRHAPRELPLASRERASAPPDERADREPDRRVAPTAQSCCSVTGVVTFAPAARIVSSAAS